MSSAGASGEADERLDATLLDELRQPLAAASNYMGAARMLIGSVNHENCSQALDQLTRAEQQLLRAGGIIGKIRISSKAGNNSRPA